ncbi:MAG: Gfo/Idh/MocA family protein [Halanaerobiaceae bacterium]
MSHKPGVAIIGCGNIFGVHAEAVQKYKNAELKAVVDIKKEKAVKAAAKYDCSYFTDYQEMLKEKEIDVVHICTPHYLHAPMSIDSLKAGKHVLVEKPMAENLDNAQKMIEVKNRHPEQHLGIVFQNRYNTTSQKARQLIQKGELGKLKGIKGIVTWYRNDDYYLQDEWRGKWETEGGGVLINQAIHTLDLVQWLGGELEAVKGNFDTRVIESIEVEDTADATLFFKDDKKGIFFASNCFSTNSPVEIVIHGEEGLLKLQNNNLILEKEDGSIDLRSEEGNDEFKSYWGQGHESLISDFYNNIRENRQDYVTAEEGIKSIEIIHGIYESSKNDQKYEIKN